MCHIAVYAEVHIVYHCSMEERPTRKEEVEHAEEKRIIFKSLCNPSGFCLMRMTSPFSGLGRQQDRSQNHRRSSELIIIIHQRRKSMRFQSFGKQVRLQQLVWAMMDYYKNDASRIFHFMLVYTLVDWISEEESL